MLPASLSLCRTCILGLLAVFIVAENQPASAEPALDRNVALSASRAALNRPVGDFTLSNRAGLPVRLDSYRGKPLLVSFIYTGCFQVCPTTTRNLQQAVITAQQKLGKDSFNVVSIGFNQPADSPQALRSYAEKYGIRQANWEFLSPSAASVDELARAFGFSFVATPAGFDHMLQLSIVDGEGRIYRQVYGDSYAADKLVEPLQQLINGAPVAETGAFSALVDRVRILCSVYDPLTGEYRVRYGLFFEIAGGITFLLWFIWFFLSEWLTRRSSRRKLNT